VGGWSRRLGSEGVTGWLFSAPAVLLLAVFMLLAPFRPMPHVLEKLIMLKNGVLNRPVDIFDLFYHLLPTILLALKIYRTYSR